MSPILCLFRSRKSTEILHGDDWLPVTSRDQVCKNMCLIASTLLSSTITHMCCPPTRPPPPPRWSSFSELSEALSLRATVLILPQVKLNL